MKPFVPVRGCPCLGCRSPSYTLCKVCWGRLEKLGVSNPCRCSKEKDR